MVRELSSSIKPARFFPRTTTSPTPLLLFGALLTIETFLPPTVFRFKDYLSFAAHSKSNIDGTPIMSEQTDGAASSSSNAEPVPEWASPQATIVTSSTPTSLINTEPASQDVSSDELATTTNNEDSTEGAAVAGMAGLCVLTDALGAFGIPSTEQHSLAHSSTAPLAQEIEYDTYLAETSNLSTTTVIPNRVDHLKTQAPTLSASMMEIDQNMATEMDLRQAEVLRSVPSAQNSRQSPESLFVGRDEQITTAAPSRNNKRGIDSVLANAEDHSEELEHRGTKRLKAEPQMPVDPLGSLDIGEDGTVIPYNPSREARPRCAAYHPEFSKVEALVVHVTKTSLQAIEQAIADGLRDDEIERIYGALTNLCSLESKYPSVRPVAIFGPAGVGKSNTINSALNQKAAAESDSANRGTNLVHEYSAPTSQQLAKYEIAARYLAGRGLSNFVVGHCDSIFDFLDREADSEEEEGGLEDLQQSYETSCNLFTILLCDHEEFESEGKVSDYFASNRDDRPAAYEELKDLIKRLKASRSLEDEVEYHQARTTRELAEKFRIVSRVSPPEGHLRSLIHGRLFAESKCAPTTICSMQAYYWETRLEPVTAIKPLSARPRITSRLLALLSLQRV